MMHAIIKRNLVLFEQLE